MLREHQQQAVVDLDGPVDWLAEFLAPLHVFRSEPDPQLFATQLLVQWVTQLRREAMQEQDDVLDDLIHQMQAERRLPSP